MARDAGFVIPMLLGRGQRGTFPGIRGGGVTSPTTMGAPEPSYDWEPGAAQQPPPDAGRVDTAPTGSGASMPSLMNKYLDLFRGYFDRDVNATPISGTWEGIGEEYTSPLFGYDKTWEEGTSGRTIPDFNKIWQPEYEDEIWKLLPPDFNKIYNPAYAKSPWQMVGGGGGGGGGGAAADMFGPGFDYYSDMIGKGVKDVLDALGIDLYGNLGEAFDAIVQNTPLRNEASGMTLEELYPLVENELARMGRQSEAGMGLMGYGEDLIRQMQNAGITSTAQAKQQALDDLRRQMGAQGMSETGAYPEAIFGEVAPKFAQQRMEAMVQPLRESAQLGPTVLSTLLEALIQPPEALEYPYHQLATTAWAAPFPMIGNLAGLLWNMFYAMSQDPSWAWGGGGMTGGYPPAAGGGGGATVPPWENEFRLLPSNKRYDKRRYRYGKEPSGKSTSGGFTKKRIDYPSKTGKM